MSKYDKKQLKRTSKLLSYCLRHRPDAIGIELDENGWTPVAELLEALKKDGKDVSRDLLEEVVRTNDKKRFSFSEDGIRIRANQGHSVQVDLKLEPKEPPETLYHGTVEKFLDSINYLGLQKGNRHHVHLSADIKTAKAVGGRRGKPVILEIDAGLMRHQGHVFYLSYNGVWLTEHVPVQFIRFPK
jgi:putative RNA 2'-phosphotransferase